MTIALCLMATALGQASLEKRDAEFLNLLAERPQGKHTVEFCRPLNTVVRPQEKLEPVAVAHSDAWMAKSLKAPYWEGAKKLQWKGVDSSDTRSKLFVKTWPGPDGLYTWMDNGVMAILHVRYEDRHNLSSEKEATTFLEDALTRILNRPEKREPTEWYVKGKELFSGTMFRGEMVPVKSANGAYHGRTFVDDLQWHMSMYMATDGANLLLRINFYGDTMETANRVTYKRF